MNPGLRGQEPKMSKARMEAFSDGVLAIIITIMVQDTDESSLARCD